MSITNTYWNSIGDDILILSSDIMDAYLESMDTFNDYQEEE